MSIYEALKQLIVAGKAASDYMVYGENINFPPLDEAITAAESALRTGGWKKWPGDKPEKAGKYLIWGIEIRNGRRRHAFCNYGGTGHWLEFSDENVIAWQPLPAPPDKE